MSAQLLSSKIVVQEDAPTFRTIAGVATGVTACIGVAGRGPINTPTLVTSLEEFEKIFGSDYLWGNTIHAVRGFFGGGGERMYFTRIVHYANISDASSKTSAPGELTLKTAAGLPTSAAVTGSVVGPFALKNNDTLVLSRDSAGSATATFTGTAASVMSATLSAAIPNGTTLRLRVDGGAEQVVTFASADFVNAADPTADEVAAAIARQTTGLAISIVTDHVALRSLIEGSDSAVEIIGGTAIAQLGFVIGVHAGTGNVGRLDAVTVADIKRVVEAAVSGVVVANVNGAVKISSAMWGTTSKITVMPTSTVAEELGLDLSMHAGTSGTPTPTLKVVAKYDGVYSMSVKILISPASSGVPSEFNLSVVFGTQVVETYTNLTMFDSAQRYAINIVNVKEPSRFIILEDLNLNPYVGGDMGERPGDSPGAPRVPFGPLTGGSDGLDGLVEVDFIGSPSTRTGLHSFDLNSDVELLIIPDGATPAIQNAALSYVSVTRKSEMFFIADPPAGMSPDGIVNYVLQTAAIKNTTECAAFYWPRVKVLNPMPDLYGQTPTIVVPPCGHIAGMYARNDGARIGGVYQPPAGVERGTMPGVLGLENDEVLDERIRDLVAQHCINPITRIRGYPIAVDDVMTLAPGGQFPTVAERRGVSFIERSIKDSIQFVRHRNNDYALRNMVKRVIEGFLVTQMRSGAFRTTDPASAFFVDVSDALNPPTEVFAGKLNIRIGLATAKPTRFVILTFSQDTRAIDAQLASVG